MEALTSGTNNKKPIHCYNARIGSSNNWERADNSLKDDTGIFFQTTTQKFPHYKHFK